MKVYGMCDKTTLEVIHTKQNKLLKILYRKDHRFSTNALYNELGLLKCMDVHKLYTYMFVYKQQNNMLPSVFNNYYAKNHTIFTRSTRQSNDLHLPFFRLSGGQKSLKYYGAKIWNDLPTDIKNIVSLSALKQSLVLMLKATYKD